MTELLCPMLATTYGHRNHKAVPMWLVSPKIDGIRCTIQSGQAWSRTGKLIPNKHIQSVLSQLPDGLDGELATSNTTDRQAFQKAVSAVMTQDGEPADWMYYVFDYFGCGAEMPKIQRLELAQQLVNAAAIPNVIVLNHAICTYDDALATCKAYCEQGGEGLMLSDPHSNYLHRRCRPTETACIKLKPMESTEGIIVGFTEATYSHGKTVPAELRGVGKGELGSLLVQCAEFSETFCIGTGFTAEQRKEFWTNQSALYDKTITFKYQFAGSKDRPRMPVFVGFRPAIDII